MMVTSTVKGNAAIPKQPQPKSKFFRTTCGAMNHGAKISGYCIFKVHIKPHGIHEVPLCLADANGACAPAWKPDSV